MDAKLVANYLTALKEKSGFTYEIIAEKCGMSVTTIKNLCNGKTEDPRLNTVAPVTYVLNGSIDEMLNPNFKKNETRSHYEHHIADIKENHAREIALKDEIIKIKDKHGNFFKILACIGLAVLISLLILEVTNPSLGWVRF